MAKTLEEYVARLANKKGHGIYDAIQEVYKLVSEGKLRLIDPAPPKVFREYLMRLDYSLWFWIIIILIAATITSIALTPIAPWITPLRYVLGTLYVLFIPGYVLIEALYPREKELRPLERLALSIGLSLAVIPLIGLVLNYTPWGIRLEPIVISTTVYSISMLILAAYRKYRIVALTASSKKKA